jgi:hypothetical protein
MALLNEASRKISGELAPMAGGFEAKKVGRMNIRPGTRKQREVHHW